MDTIRINITAGSGRSVLAIELESAQSTESCTVAEVARALPTAEFQRHTKIFSDGSRVPGNDPRTDHVALIDHSTGLMWSVESLRKPANAEDGMPLQKCADRCSELRLLGHDDWRLPTHAELSALVDVSRRNPAIDTNLFPRVLPRWHWTSTPLVDSDGTASASVAWLVYFYSGVVSSVDRGSGGFALAVRRPGQ